MSETKNLDEMRMAIGFLDSSEMAKKGRLETFIALLELTKDTIETSPVIEIEMSQLTALKGLNTCSYDEIRQRLRDLMSTIIGWSCNGVHNNKGWIDSQILGPVTFDGSRIRTSFQEPVWKKIRASKNTTKKLC